MGTSVVVVTRRPEQYLDRCLESVADQAEELIVVDNDSAGTICEEICNRYGAKRLRQSENVGFAPGVNVGVSAATQDHVALLNDDAFADPGWLEHSAEVLADPTIGAVVPKLLFAWRRAIVRLDDPIRFKARSNLPYGRHVTSVMAGDHEVIAGAGPVGGHAAEDEGFWTSGATLLIVPLMEHEEDVRINGEPVEIETRFDLVNNAGSFLHPGGWCGDIGYARRDDGTFDHPTDRFAACGAAVVTRRETWGELGGLAENFFAYYEDSDWSWRLQLAGLRVRYEPSTIVRHVHAQTGKEGSPWFNFFVARNRILCVTRNAPRRIVARTLLRLPPLPDGVPKSLVKAVPLALRDRRRNSRLWRRTPEEVWDQWAGVSLPR